MPEDTFICGTCTTAFYNIEQFVLHKNEQCGAKDSVAMEVGEAGGVVVEGYGSYVGGVVYTEDTSQVTGQLQSGNGYTVNTAQELIVSDPTVEELELTDEQGNIIKCAVPSEILGTVSDSLLSGTLLEAQLLGDSQTVIILQGDYPNINVEGATSQVVTEMLADNYPMATALLAETAPKKKRGRPKRSEERKKPVVTKPPPPAPEPNRPDIGKDGRLTCTKCRKSFVKQRVFNAHKCMADSDYVDFSHKEPPNIEPDDNHMPQDDVEDSGAIESDTGDNDYRLPPQVKLEPDKWPREITSGDALDSVNPSPKTEPMEEGEPMPVGTPWPASDSPTIDPGATDTPHNDHAIPVADGTATGDIEEGGVEGRTEGAGDGGDQTEGTGNREGSNSQGNLGNVEVEADPDVNTGPASKPTDSIDNIPVFESEEERLTFEQTLNIDLSGVDSMFRVHCIEQDLNEYAMASSRLLTNQLSLYSCNTCDKVFKTLSHMRFHCLTHTDLKPFKCPRCSYRSNVRGNLYTHMRKHTGQYYRCQLCKFKTVNKSHLLEHEQTHRNVRHTCNMCKKTYNTHKSLINHVRKYHTSKNGKEYLETFLSGREMKGSTIIHQCHVCNRKFKKKMDRDRHLFVHDIKDIPSIQHCWLCDYTACRPKYLEKHFQKHRCIYKCCKCDEQFLSSLRLIDHLTAAHMQDKRAVDCEVLFEECINSSLYLPEPDVVISLEEKELINLPPELSQSIMEQASQDGKLHVSGGLVISDDVTAGDEYINKVPPDGEDGETEGTTIPQLGVVTVMDIADTVADTVADTASTTDAVEGQPLTGLDCDTESHTDNYNNGEKQMEGSSEPDRTMSEEADGVGDITKGETELIGMAEKPLLSDSAMLVAGALSDSDSTAPGYDLKATQDSNSQLNADKTQDNSEEETKNDKPQVVKWEDLIERLDYLPMSMQIFQKMRDTFGTEECEYCGRLFFSKTDYEPHVRTHTGDKPHVCQQCGYSAITKDNLKRHIEKEHENIVFWCKECTYKASSRTQLWNHQLKHRGLKGLLCPECHEHFESLKELRVHAASRHPNCARDDIEKITNTAFRHKMQGKMGRRSYKCPHCEKVFFRANSELQKHLWIHEGIKPFKCPLCPHSCRSKNNLQAHMLRHTKEKPFACGECGKAYKSKTALRWHVRSHASGNMFKCEKCPYDATQRSHLKRHMETHDVLKRFACSHCEYSANTLGYLKIHYTRFHKDVNINAVPHIVMPPGEAQPQPDRNVFKCLSCDYLFGNLSDLKRHLKLRHQVHVKDLQSVDSAGSEVSEFQIVQVQDGGPGTVVAECLPAQGVLDTGPQVAGGEEAVVEEMDEKTASAVTILQQIISQGGLGQAAPDGSFVSIDSSDVQQIIVQADDGMFVTNGEMDVDGNQYVIQYVTPQDVPGELSMVEIQTDTDLHDLTGGGQESHDGPITQELQVEETVQEPPVTYNSHEMQVGQMEVETSI